MTENIFAISTVLKGKAVFSSVNYQEMFIRAKKGDLVYMDPPYQGVGRNRDNRYISNIDYDDFCESLKVLNDKNMDFIVSYDGSCGGECYGNELPESLGCKRILLNAGPSTQQTLLGKRAITYESLYISANLYERVSRLQNWCA